MKLPQKGFPTMCFCKKISSFALGSIVAVLLLGKIPFAATYIIGPEDKSVYIDQRDPNINFVSTRGLLTASELNENARTVIHFNLSEWSGDSISEAKLCLYHYRGGYYSVSRTINVYPLTTTFNESTATWNYPWTSPGGDFDSSVSASADVPEAEGNWVEWDVTGILKNRWSNITECGFLLKDPVEDTPVDGPYVRFRSRRHVDEAPLELPYLRITTGGTGVEDVDFDCVSRSFWLGQNFPNPFNNKTILQFDLPHTSGVSLVIYNLLGERVKTLLEERREAGTYTVEWDGTDHSGNSVSSGMYLCRLQAGNYSQTKRLLYLK
jgi:hypothetical protein